MRKGPPTAGQLLADPTFHLLLLPSVKQSINKPYKYDGRARLSVTENRPFTQQLAAAAEGQRTFV
jgi:hypothetical protein